MRAILVNSLPETQIMAPGRFSWSRVRVLASSRPCPSSLSVEHGQGLLMTLWKLLTEILQNVEQPSNSFVSFFLLFSSISSTHCIKLSTKSLVNKCGQTIICKPSSIRPFSCAILHFLTWSPISRTVFLRFVCVLHPANPSVPRNCDMDIGQSNWCKYL